LAGDIERANGSTLQHTTSGWASNGTYLKK
jgi:hypothetical protein